MSGSGLNRSKVTRTLRGWFPGASVREVDVRGVPMLEAWTADDRLLARVFAEKGYEGLVEAMLPWLAHCVRRGQLRLRNLTVAA